MRIGSGGNHFPARAKMWDYGSPDTMETDRGFTEAPQLHQKSTPYIKATFKTRILWKQLGWILFYKRSFAPDPKSFNRTGEITIETTVREAEKGQMRVGKCTKQILY